MFKTFIAIIAIAFFASCNNATNTTDVKTDSLINSGVNDILLQTTFEVQKLKGLYSGTFDGSPISISINYVSGKNVSGYNVHKGLKRNMRGTMQPFGTQIKLLLDEPGNNRFDGHFEMFIDTASFSGKGTWKPKNDSSLKTKDFSFTKSEDEGNGYRNLEAIWSDSLDRSFELKFDGTAIFAFYTGKGTPQEQLQNFSGNWQKKADSVIIYWQPNSIFPGRRSSFFMVKEIFPEDSSFYITGLKGEKMGWFNMSP